MKFHASYVHDFVRGAESVAIHGVFLSQCAIVVSISKCKPIIEKNKAVT
jgi:hypothetical protein